MSEERDNVVRFRPRPKRPPQPARRAQPASERAINWSRAPKALVIIILFFVAMSLMGGLASWISGLGR